MLICGDKGDEDGGAAVEADVTQEGVFLHLHGAAAAADKDDKCEDDVADKEATADGLAEGDRDGRGVHLRGSRLVRFERRGRADGGAGRTVP